MSGGTDNSWAAAVVSYGAHCLFRTPSDSSSPSSHFLVELEARGRGAVRSGYVTCIESFWRSRWFWTLQELIAPNSVAPFSSEEHYLGDKKSLI